MFAELNGKKIYFEIHGDGPLSKKCASLSKAKPVMFLVHGGPGIDHSGI